MDSVNFKVLVKKYFIRTGACCGILAGIFLALFITLDPLQLYRRSSAPDAPLSANMRVQAAGVLNTFDVDSLILGTSMLENTSAAEASAKLGGKFFNISLPGAGYPERALILRKALQKPRKNIIYSLDHYYLDCKQRDPNFPAYLYDDNPFNDIKQYAAWTHIKNLFLPDLGLTQHDHDRPNAWFALPSHKNRFGGIGNWVAHRENAQVKGVLLEALPEAAATSAAARRTEVHDSQKELGAKRYMEENLLEILAEHQDTNFYLIFPPYSRLRFAFLRRKTPEDFFLHQEIIRYLVERTKDKKNIHIYGFEDQDFPDDIANYKDVTHYHQKFNTLFLDAMAAGKHELTPENVEDYLKRCEQKAWDYDIPALHDEAQRLMKQTAKKGNG